MQKFGLCRPAFPAEHFCSYLPLAAIVAVNLWRGFAMSMALPTEKAMA